LWSAGLVSRSWTHDIHYTVNNRANCRIHKPKPSSFKHSYILILFKIILFKIQLSIILPWMWQNRDSYNNSSTLKIYPHFIIVNESPLSYRRTTQFYIKLLRNTLISSYYTVFFWTKIYNTCDYFPDCCVRRVRNDLIW